MAKIEKVLKEIEKRLSRGQSPTEVAKALGIPLHWVTETEMDMEWTGYPVDFQPTEK
jgi:DNA-directed RNA polymerase specialized sigma subunit